jgi:hypothetical protein
MMTCIAIALACWVCALVSSPQKPLPGNEVQELVYSRLLGRYQRVVLLALAATIAVAFVLMVTLAQHSRPDAASARDADIVCADTPGSLPTCYRRVLGGWQEEQLGADGQWHLVGVPKPLPPVREKDQPLGG